MPNYEPRHAPFKPWGSETEFDYLQRRMDDLAAELADIRAMLDPAILAKAILTAPLRMGEPDD